MNIHPIRTKADYENTLDRIEAIFEATPNTPEFDELEILTLLVMDYEAKYYPIEDSDLIQL